MDLTVNESDPIEYQTRAVAFIDVLGWKNLVTDSLHDAKLRHRMHNAIGALGALARQYAGEEDSRTKSYDRALQFSDNIAISIPYTRPSDLARLARQIAEYQSVMALSGFLMRGGITVGPLYHEGSIVLGPALNDAVEFESSIARTPRVIVAKHLTDALLEEGRKLPSHWPFIRTDDDDFVFLDYLTTIATSPAGTKTLEAFIAEGIEKNASVARHLENYRWLERKWAEAKADSKWRLEISLRLRESLAKP